ncbi:MAG TPA: DNA topoisomerase IV subunit B [Bacteroidales bacterium]|nr:type IIA DNA topoisomerase subunit B [Bacteroidales bacterium]OQB63356.1 MAG: DNA gyrase subunit B [Bacteroidetes bacterium ADurb.Bin145]NMD02296.1 type IIA DNA topoisomerase subunit B [Bacteroidales bacterium]HOU01788.1 DNA topoisomerase IV subunit B [Bacteroidales bacterium]HQG62310.1 DNA topoisomerase IV subunit B [Bacteroidales bacterium]
MTVVGYSEEHIKTLEWREHIRLRPGMYIGKLGDGSSQDDGIYVLLKEVMDNAIDEYMMGFGKKIDVEINGREVRVRDYGRGIPLGKLLDAVSKMNTGAKYDSKAFKKSVGLNGIGVKAVNALSSRFVVKSVRDGQMKTGEFEHGLLVKDHPVKATNEENGVEVVFQPDENMFGNYFYMSEYVDTMLKNYVYLNSGLVINFNGNKFFSKNGLADLLNENMSKEGLYPLIHLKDDDIEVAFTHGLQYGEDYYSFVNGQNTTQGGTHLLAFKEALVRTIRDFYKKEFDPADIRSSIIAAISIKVEEPIFESQTKTKLGSKDMGPEGPSVRTFIVDYIKKHLDDYLHKNYETAGILLKKIQESEKERKAISSIQKIARDRAKKVSLHNKKLRDCRVHYNTNDPNKLDSTIFITEGDSASGSITKSRSVETQAVFSLRGKPLNSFGLTKKIVYENEEFNLLQAALNIEDGIENLRYNNVVIATDADVDGMHIRLLMLTFFLQFFPELVKKGHVYILQTPLFRVRNKKETRYCYTLDEKMKAIKDLGPDPEITRFKGLGEISPEEFSHFIGKDMRLEPVRLKKNDAVNGYLEFYMGKNTQARQDFIIENLRIEEDVLQEEIY